MKAITFCNCQGVTESLGRIELWKQLRELVFCFYELRLEINAENWAEVGMVAPLAQRGQRLVLGVSRVAFGLDCDVFASTRKSNLPK